MEETIDGAKHRGVGRAGRGRPELRSRNEFGEASHGELESGADGEVGGGEVEDNQEREALSQGKLSTVPTEEAGGRCELHGRELRTNSSRQSARWSTGCRA